jgi:hypothetical protein
MQDQEGDGRMTRRELARRGIALALVLGGAGGAGRVHAEEPLVNEVPENAALVQALSYVNQSAVAGSNCANCALYLGGGAPKGKCGLFQKGVVAGTGYCTSWSKKSS